MDISGWEVTRVQGSMVEMCFENEITVAFDVQEISRGRSAVILPSKDVDAIRQFTCATLSSECLKGDVRTVSSFSSQLILDLEYSVPGASSLTTITNGISPHQIETSDNHHLH